jgi:EAL domain-containing protein (putative c-di-GMP-specific phosphodiesterase class I)
MNAIDGIEGGLVLQYQPIVDLNTGAVGGFEALARVARPDGQAMMSLGATIERIEDDLPALQKLMYAVLRNVRNDVVTHFAAHPGFYVSVNVPPAIIGHGEITEMLAEFDLLRWLPRLMCEVTERQALTDAGRQLLRAGRELGIRVAIDDFGIGHSGLKQLLGLDFDVLKIDRSQIEPLLRDATSDRLVRGIVALAGALRVRVIAEGVESPAHAFFLRAAGVDYGQGWLWSKGIAAAEIPGVLARGFEPPSWT